MMDNNYQYQWLSTPPSSRDIAIIDSRDIDIFEKLVPYHVDFQFFLSDNQDIRNRTGGKTGLSNSSNTGILNVVTGNKPDQDRAHDALYDAEILHDLMFNFLKSGNWYHETMGSFRMNAVTEINYGAIGRGLLKSRRKRFKKPSSGGGGIFYPPGFASFQWIVFNCNLYNIFNIPRKWKWLQRILRNLLTINMRIIKCNYVSERLNRKINNMASAKDPKEPKEPSFKSRLQAITRDYYKVLEQEKQVI